jgi:hypothetical protein
MTVDELYSELTGLSDHVESFDLQMLVWQIDKQIAAQAFDPLTELDPVAGPEVEQLQMMIPQVDQAIVTEQHRVQLVETIIALASGALRAAGVALP